MWPVTHGVSAQIQMPAPQILSWLGWIFVLAAIAILGSSLLIDGSAIDHLKNALPSGVLLALAGQLFTQSRSLSEVREKHSQFNLENALKAYEQARTLLADESNERVKWIEAGRVLGHAIALAGEVTVEAHQRVLEFNKLKYRSFFHELLASKPASFFYGVSEVTLPLDEAARRSNAPEEINGRRITSPAHEFSESSIYAIWQAAQWPDDYIDPLNKKFTDSERSKLIVLFPGLHQFFEDKQQRHSDSGVLHPRGQRT